MYKRFRWTPKNTPSILFWGFGVPIFAFFAFAKTNVRAFYLPRQNRWDFTGKGHDQSLLRVPPAAPKSVSDEEED